jgi:hypothetical protein
MSSVVSSVVSMVSPTINQLIEITYGRNKLWYYKL